MERIWNNLLATLDARSPDWQSRVMGYGQVDLANKRAAGESFSDEEVFKGVLWAVLSSNIDWSRVERALPELEDWIGSYSPQLYSSRDATYIDDLNDWFKSKKAGSMVLRRNLTYLIDTAQILSDWSSKHGSADSYFTKAVQDGGDPFAAVMLLGNDPSYKLPALGTAIAAETMRNLGYDIAKPDRHICRAMGCWGLMEYQKWPDRSGNKNPAAGNDELLETMRAFDRFAKVVGESAIYMDNAIWFACSIGGPNLTNDELGYLSEK